MDKKVYEKTRYQNIYRHKKNKNYIIMMSKPVKTSISRVDGKKIMSTKDAIKVRDNIVLKKQKATEILNKETFDELWDKYIFWCKFVQKQAYKTYNKKEKLYKKYFKEKIKKPVSKTNKNFWSEFINDCNCTDKQKNEILKSLKAFMNWCVDEGYIEGNPLSNVQKYKVEKSEMKYWIPNNLHNFIEALDNDINGDDIKKKEIAYRTKIFTLLGFSLGDRTGETRALNLNQVKIQHSINYDPLSNDFVSHTKTYSSQRNIDVTDKLIKAILEYKMFLIKEMNYNISNDTLIFLNHKTGKPISDSTLRKHFYKYCEIANVPKIRLYDLRHTYVATMMSEGLELYHISERLGHTNFSTTVNKYGHLSNEKRKEIAKTTDKYY